MDRIEGMKVIDLQADNEADAKGKAHRAAGELGCKQISSVTAACWTSLPRAWLRLESHRS